MRAVRFRRFATVVVIATLASCAASEIKQTSADEYVLARADKGGYLWGDEVEMKVEVLREIEEFAKSRGKLAMPLSMYERPLQPGILAKIEVRFRLVDPAPSLSNVDGVTGPSPRTEAKAIDFYFADRELSPIEGIWTWDNNEYQVAIIRNETGIEDQYDFLGVIIRADSGSWNPGDVKLLLNSTASVTVFTGVYFDRGKFRRNLSYILEDANIIKVNETFDDGQPFLIRDYPVGRTQNISSNGKNVSLGTCFLVGPEGTAITSHHVIDGASHILVTLADGRELLATVKTSSAATDIAVMDLDAATPNYMSLGSTRSTRAGEQVFTFGFPTIEILGSEAKFTEGSITALSGIRGEAAYMQISVPIQPGNSGGPIVNHDGEVLGVVAATAAVEAFYEVTGALPQNVNWAVKSDFVRAMIDEAPRLAKTADRDSAISRAQSAVCRVSASY